LYSFFQQAFDRVIHLLRLNLIPQKLNVTWWLRVTKQTKKFSNFPLMSFETNVFSSPRRKKGDPSLTMAEKRSGTKVLSHYANTAMALPSSSSKGNSIFDIETSKDNSPTMLDDDNDDDNHGDDPQQQQHGLLHGTTTKASSTSLSKLSSSNTASTMTSTNTTNSNSNAGPPQQKATISAMGFKVLILLALQNSSKNLLLRFVMRKRPEFLTSAAVIGSELTKLTLSVLYIVVVERKSMSSIVDYVVRIDVKNTILVVVPASAYNLQMTLEYIALANLDAAMFSVLVQTKLLCTATFAALVLNKKLKYIQLISLLLLTVGVMLCNMKLKTSSTTTTSTTTTTTTTKDDDEDDNDAKTMKGILATLGIALSSGFASVYTEKVIKSPNRASNRPNWTTDGSEFSLAYTQVQLASMSLVAMGIYAMIMDFRPIVEYGLFYKFDGGAILTVLNSAIGGLIVAAVLKYADSVLKGYATAISVILTGVLSMFLFGTQLHMVYFLGIINVVVAVLLYNGKNLDQLIC
jgi:solute carrier family 35 (UDP-sugar transporter), member A1/2/3